MKLVDDTAEPQPKAGTKDRIVGVVNKIEPPQQSTKQKFLRLQVTNVWLTLYEDKFDMLHNKIYEGDHVELEYWVTEGKFGRVYKNINWIHKTGDAQPEETPMDLMRDAIFQMRDQMNELHNDIGKLFEFHAVVRKGNICPSCQGVLTIDRDDGQSFALHATCMDCKLGWNLIRERVETPKTAGGQTQL